MNTIGQSELVDFAAFWRKRPPKIGQKAKAKSQVSVLYAARVVAALKSFLSWASDHPDIAWSKPPRFDALLLIRTSRPTTSAEKEVIKAKVLGESQRFFTIDELQRVFRVADPAMQAFILLGLNCAYSSSEIANLKVTDLRYDGSPRIETVRHKTISREHPVPSKHFLWPETYERVMVAKAKTNKDGYMFLTPTGKPLVSAKYNAFPHAWDAVREAAGLKDALSFKHLRKTSANEMRKLAGMEVADVHLAHGEKLKMIGPYTDRLWDQHKAATGQLREVFKKVWS
jgi:integrase